MARAEAAMTRGHAWVRFALIGMACMALSAGVQPWFDALGGAFVPADIAQDSAAARLFVKGVNPYGPVIRQAHAELLDVPVEGTFPHFPHPPFSLIISLPLAFGGFELSALLWFGFTFALIFVLATLLAKALYEPVTEGPAVPVRVWPVWLMLLAWPPVLYNLEKGQWSVPLAVLLALAWQAIARGNVRSAARWAATAAAVKVFPVVLGVYFVLRSAKAIAWFVGTGLVLTAVPLVWIGPSALFAFLRESRLNMPYWESFPSVMFSLHGAVARLLVGGRWAEPLVSAPRTAWALELIVVSVVVGAAAWITIRARRGMADQGMAFAAWIVLLPMLNPQSLGHNGTLLALPLVLVGRALAGSGRKWQQWAWAVACILVSVPKQTVWNLAPPPVGPLEGIAIVGLPTWGSLLLFAVTVSAAASATAIARRSPASV
jgi:hypothetical protein